MVFSPNDCHGLKRLLGGGGGGGSGGSGGSGSSSSAIIFVPKGTVQSKIEITEVATSIVPATTSPVARLITVTNESVTETTILISLGSPASLGNYLYPLKRHLIIDEAIDGGELWSAICPAGETGILRVAITPFIKIF
jgi:hypothetical protein